MNMKQIYKEHTYDILEQLHSEDGHSWLDMNGQFGIEVKWDTIADLKKGRFFVTPWDGSRGYAGPNERTMCGFSLDDDSSFIEVELALAIEEIRDQVLTDA